MANHKSAAKRAKQSLRKKTVNSKRKSTVRTWEKKVRTAIASKQTDEATTLLKKFTKEIAIAAKSGVVHKNAVARKVSRLSSQISALNS